MLSVTEIVDNDSGPLETMVLTDITQEGVIDFYTENGPSIEQNIFATGNSYDIRIIVTKVSALPVPAAIWLFGSGLLGFPG
jgi:hypothetical protein